MTAIANVEYANNNKRQVANIANHILARLHRVEFIEISTSMQSVRFRHGHVEYTAVENTIGTLDVYRWDSDTKVVAIMDSYQAWMDGVLNGKTRNDKGELS